MKKFNSQAETHSRPGEALRGSRPPCAEAHSKLSGSPLASSSYFFLFLNRLQAQAHRDPGSTPRASRKDLFFLFINRLQAQAQAHATAAADQVKATHYFIDSPYYIGY